MITNGVIIDYQSWLELMYRAKTSVTPVAILKALKQDKAQLFGSERDGVPRAFMLIETDTDHVRVVLHHSENQECAQSLWRYIHKWCAKMGYDYILMNIKKYPRVIQRIFGMQITSYNMRVDV